MEKQLLALPRAQEGRQPGNGQLKLREGRWRVGHCPVAVVAVAGLQGAAIARHGSAESAALECPEIALHQLERHAGAVAGCTVANGAELAGQCLKDGFSEDVEFFSLVAPQREIMAQHQPQQKSAESRHRTAEELEEELAHKVWGLAARHVGLLLLGIVLTGSWSALAKIYLVPRDFMREPRRLIDEFWLWYPWIGRR